MDSTIENTLNKELENGWLIELFYEARGTNSNKIIVTLYKEESPLDKTEFMWALRRNEKPMDRGRYKRIIRESIDCKMEICSHHDLIICMEELAELQQALSKELRGKGDSVNILEEVADVLLCIGFIQEIVGLSDDLIVSAMNVKIDRLENILNKGDKS